MEDRYTRGLINRLGDVSDDGAGVLPEPIMVTRRQFVRSLSLSLPALLVLPGAIHAATRHTTPLLPTFNPLPDFSDPNWWWNAARESLLLGLNAIPGIGVILGFIGAIFLPTSVVDDFSAQWKQFVEAINKQIDERIDAFCYNLMKSRLEGLTDCMSQYLTVAKYPGSTAKQLVWILHFDYSDAMPSLCLEGHESALLPVYVQAASQHLALLREVVLGAEALGLDPQEKDFFSNQLQSRVADYGAWTDRWIAERMSHIMDGTAWSAGRHDCKRLNALLTAQTQHQITALDFRDSWPYFEARNHPARVQMTINREVFSPLLGSYFDGDQVVPDWLPEQTPPLAAPSSIQIRAGGFVDGITLRYPNGGGPDGANEMVCGGDGGTAHEIDLRVSGDITGLEVGHGYAVDGIRLKFASGEWSPWFGDASRADGCSRVAFAGHRLSSLRGFGLAKNYGDVVSGICAGFQLIKQRADDLGHA